MLHVFPLQAHSRRCPIAPGQQTREKGGLGMGQSRAQLSALPPPRAAQPLCLSVLSCKVQVVGDTGWLAAGGSALKADLGPPLQFSHTPTSWHHTGLRSGWTVSVRSTCKIWKPKSLPAPTNASLILFIPRPHPQSHTSCPDADGLWRLRAKQ